MLRQLQILFAAALLLTAALTAASLRQPLSIARDGARGYEQLYAYRGWIVYHRYGPSNLGPVNWSLERNGEGLWGVKWHGPMMIVDEGRGVREAVAWLPLWGLCAVWAAALGAVVWCRRRRKQRMGFEVVCGLFTNEGGQT